MEETFLILIFSAVTIISVIGICYALPDLIEKCRNKKRR